ncbi:NAD-dependent epimerase/dehydratase family protein [Haloferacaceae archaeon DSL9]
MTDTALVIGGTRFIGRHTVEELLEHDYEVSIFNRGNHENPFADRDGVTHIAGDRTDREALEAAAVDADPDVVIDCVAYKPDEVEAAVEIFSEVSGYVYISSGDAYGEEVIPKREGVTELRPCSDEQAVDESPETYGNRKAAGDRVVFEAAARGVNAMAVRPCIVYGPHDYTERLDYWLDRVATYDRVVVPGDGQNVWHRAYVEDVAAALRTVAERGEPGEAYNVGDRRLVTLEEMVSLIAEVMETGVEIVHAGERELAAGEFALEDFILYRDYPHVLSTSKLAALGWASTPLREAMARTVEEHLDGDRDGDEYDPGRENEARVLGVLETI